MKFFYSIRLFKVTDAPLAVCVFFFSPHFGRTSHACHCQSGKVEQSQTLALYNHTAHPHLTPKTSRESKEPTWMGPCNHCFMSCSNHRLLLMEFPVLLKNILKLCLTFFYPCGGGQMQRSHREGCGGWISDALAAHSQVALCADPPRMLGKGSSGSKGTWNTAERGISGLRGSLGILQR